jgi:hypothetical protein
MDYLEDNPEENTLHELILPNKYLKPFMDVDMKKLKSLLEAERILGYIITASMNVFERLKRKIDLSKDIRIHTSHGKTKDGYYKYSYLIIFDNFCLFDLEHVKYIVQLIIEELKEQNLEYITEYIDNSVYSRNHTIRCLGSTKLGENRIRKLEYKWNYYSGENGVQEIILYKDPENKDDVYASKFEDIQKSFITNIHYGKSECKLLGIELPYPKKEISDLKEIDLNSKQIKYIFSKIYKIINKEDFEPDVDNIKDNCIFLKRLKPSFCKICKREHESQNQYIFFGENGIYLKCFQNNRPGKYIKIGDLPDNKNCKEKDKERKDDKGKRRTGLIIRRPGEENNEESESEEEIDDSEKEDRDGESDKEEEKDKEAEIEYLHEDPEWNIITGENHNGHAKLFENYKRINVLRQI